MYRHQTSDVRRQSYVVTYLVVDNISAIPDIKFYLCYTNDVIAIILSQI